MQPEAGAHYEALIPEGAIPLYGMRFVSYIDEDGCENFQFGVDGEAKWPRLLALIETCKVLLIQQEVGNRGDLDA